MSKPVDLDKAPIPTLFFKYYVPAITSLLSVTIHQVVNGIILGKYIGKDGVAAVGLFGPVLIVFIAFALALMIGGGILVARNIGAKNFSHAQEVFQFTTSLAVTFGGLVALSSPFITAPVTSFLAGAEGEAIAKSTYDYMLWGFIWLPFFFLRMLWGNFVNSDGAPKVSRNASLLAVGLNIVLDILFIIVIPLGTAGASIATGISIVAAVVYLFVYINREKGHLNFRTFRFTFRLAEWKELVQYGIPSFVSEISFSFGLLILNKSLVPFGALAVSAFGLVNHISFIFIRLFTAAMISVLPIISFNIGARLPARVIETLRFSLMFTILLGIVIAGIGFSIPGPLVGVFSSNESEEFNQIVVNATTLYFILFLAAGPNYLLGAYFQAIGKTRMSIAVNVLKGFVLVVLFILLLPGYFDLGVKGVWLSRSLAEIGALIIIAVITLYNRVDYYSQEAILRKK